MDNQNARPTLQPPNVPADFESSAGTSRTDFATALLELLKESTIEGVNPENPTSFDFSALQAQVTALEADMQNIKARTPRRVIMSGVTNGLVVVPFQDVGTANYQVDLAFVTPNVNFPAINWAIINGSKKSDQVQLRIDGDAGSYSMEITITPMDGI